MCVKQLKMSSICLPLERIRECSKFFRSSPLFSALYALNGQNSAADWPGRLNFYSTPFELLATLFSMISTNSWYGLVWSGFP
jgi:hypothetical protein